MRPAGYAPAVSLPPWLPLVPDLPDREAEIAEGLRRLRERGRAVVAGEPGIGKTSVAGAILARHGREACALSAGGCEEAADLLRAVGQALGLHPCGDEGQLRVALRGAALLFVDDVATDAVAAEAERLAGEAEIPVLSVREEAPDALRLGPLPGGNPALLRLAAGRPLEQALAAASVAGFLVPFPMGLPPGNAPPLPAALLRPDGADRLVLRRAYAARLAPSPTAWTDAADRVEPLVRTLAHGGHLAGWPDPADLLLLRLLARQLPDRADRLRAAAARLAARFGQLHVARALLAEAPPTTATGRGLLAWADADVLLVGGALADAMERVEAAAAAFTAAGDGAAKAAMLRRVADRLTVRGETGRAEALYESARALYRALGQPVGVAATRRGAADLALLSGASVGVTALHEDVEESLTLSPNAGERANLRLAQAALAAMRGELARAESILAEIDLRDAPPLLRANVARRRGDLALRRGETGAALRDADEAARIYGTLGETVAEGAATRLAGDALGAAGRAGEALGRYGAAIRLQVRTRDLRGLARTLDHAATVADWAGEFDLARRWREQRADVVRVSE